MTRPTASLTVNPIDVVESAYDLERDDRDWLRHVTETIRPLIDGGLGITAYYFDVRGDPGRWLDDAVLLDLDRHFLRDMSELVVSTPKITEATHLHPESFASAVDIGRRAGLGDLRDIPAVGSLFARLGVRDYIALRTIEPEGRGICITAGQDQDRAIDPRSGRLWACVAAHIAAARRLRAALEPSAGASTDAEHVEAVLTPSGKLDHAEGEARSHRGRAALRDAVLRQERARGRARREDPEGATEAWTALVSGRWSLVDRFEENGRRYIVARHNAPQVTDPRSLTERERVIAQLVALGKPNKLIAYELGLATSTVANHVVAAMRKLRASSRVELVRLVATMSRVSET